MIVDEFDAALHVFCRRRPFAAFCIEFTSGAQIEIRHPEVVRRRGLFYVLRATDGGFTIFVPESVTRLLDVSAGKKAT